jgi:general secretion pathway protein D
VDFFLTILHIAGFAVVEQGEPRVFRIITTINEANRSPLPIFLGTKPAKLPDNDQVVRYVYFLENTTIDAVKGIIDALRSTTSNFFTLKDFNAFVLTDKAYNIKNLMRIITELDTTSMPETMSVLKLKKRVPLMLKNYMTI